MVELIGAIVILLIAVVTFLFISTLLPIAILTPGSVKTTKKTSFKEAHICWTHGKVRFDEVVMRCLLFQFPITYTVYTEPEKIDISIEPSLLLTRLSVYPSRTAYFFVDNCATYYFDARRMVVFVPNVEEANKWQLNLEKLRQAKIAKDKCQYEPILITI